MSGIQLAALCVRNGSKADTRVDPQEVTLGAGARRKCLPQLALAASQSVHWGGGGGRHGAVL